MEPELPPPPSMAALPINNASSAPPSSSPRSGGSSSFIMTDKADESFSSLSSDAGDQSILRHPKGKRKRTAAKDKALLEAAYQANPKPDKTARLDIVRQVSLNEKEVQIWFQNRRQNDRRKSRPLSPQEIAALRYGGMHALSSDPPPPFAHSVLPQTSSFSSDAGASSPPHHLPLNSASMPTAMPSTTPASSPELGPWLPERRPYERSGNPGPEMSDIPTPPASQSFASSVGSVGYLANRWNMHSLFSSPSSQSTGGGARAPDGPRDESARQVSSSSLAHPSQQQPFTPSHQRPFRLSLSLDGKAEVIPSQSPSPPRRLPLPPQATVPLGKTFDGSSSSHGASEGSLLALPAIRRSGLSRSQSAFSPTTGLTLPPISSLTDSLAGGSAPPTLRHPAHPPRLLRGRSRDVHAWESVCDAETRVDDELSAHAENEASGSAIAAISLLRSASSSSTSLVSPSSAVLQPNGSKRNGMARSGAPRPGMRRSKLGRAWSSVARMQTVSGSADVWSTDKDKAWVDDEKKKKLKLSTLLSGNDSDKENWSPVDNDRPLSNPPLSSSMASNGRRPLPFSRNGQQQPAVLGEGKGNKKPILNSRVAGGKGGTSFDGVDIYVDRSQESDRTPLKRVHLSRPTADSAPIEHTDRFVHSATVSPSKKGDMDCVAGLLSLSQGNWR